MTSYELSIKDNLLRTVYYPDLINAENSIKQTAELNIIKSIIDIVKEDEALNEE